MTAILFFQVIFSIILAALTGNLPLSFLESKARMGKLGFFEKRDASLESNYLPASADKPSPPKRKPGSRSVGIEISANVAAAVDMVSGKTLFEKKADFAMPLASLTKLMTALVALEAPPEWEREVVIMESDLREGPRSMNAGDKITIKDLFYSALVASENTAAVALSRSMDIAPDEFILRMNAKAEELGMLNSSFKDVTGLDPGNIANALDVAVLARAAFKEEKIKNALMTSSYEIVKSNTGEKKNIKNTDRLLDGVLNREPFKIQGGKTGYIDESGYNFVFEVKGGKKQDLVVVVFGSESAEARFEDAKNLALWAFENFDWEK
ncbi:D-alanyl-D-alanine carboxypeptidase [Candidatus Uhrbacteria bacterium]|nr:D-alanyl-D-alanine carboxypeptidase [Candidatus Uhrbacteria bacterium]